MQRCFLPGAGVLLLAALVVVSALSAQSPPARDPDVPDKPGLYGRPILPYPPRPLPPRPFPGDDYLLPRPPRPMSVGLDILADGVPLATIIRGGRTYLPVSRLGAEYQLRVTNRGTHRITAITSVDGISVITRRPASQRDPGYIVAPGGRLTIPGWRQDRDTVRAFRFEDRDRSFAAELGRPENVGVIGLVAFEEWTLPRRLPMEGYSKADSSPRAAVGGTGTAEGRELWSPVVTVPFVRSANKQMITIYYDTADNLRRAGIPVDFSPPEPFPRDR